MRWVRWLFAAWLLASPMLQVNLFRVRNSGIYPSLALLTLLVLCVGVLVLRQPSLVPWRSRMTVPLIAFGVAAVLAGIQGALFYDRTVAGVHRYVAVQIYAVALVELSIAAAFVTAVLVRTTDDLRWLRQLIVAAAGLLLVRDFLHLFLPMPFRTVFWWPFVGAHAATFVGAWLLYEAKGNTRAIIAGLLFIAGMAAKVMLFPFLVDLASAQWLSSWIALGVGLGLLILARFPRATLRLVLPATALFLFWQFDRVERVYHLAYEEGDFLRLRLWEDAIRLTAQRPFLGVGPGNYLDYIYRYGQLGVILSSPHGNYQQIAAEMGFVGLGFALWVFARALGLGWRIYQRAREPLVRSLAIAAVCGLAGQLTAAFVGDFVVPNYHNGGYINVGATIYAWVLIGMLMALERIEHPALSSPQATAEPENRDQRHQPSGDPLERQG